MAGKFIGVARIFPGVHFFLQKSWLPFLVVALPSKHKQKMNHS